MSRSSDCRRSSEVGPRRPTACDLRAVASKDWDGGIRAAVLSWNPAGSAKFRGFSVCAQRSGTSAMLREDAVRMPGAGFEPARPCEQQFLRPPAYAVRPPGHARRILRARPVAADEAVSAAGVLQSALERRVGATRGAVGVDEPGVEAVTAAVAGAEPVVAVEPLDVLVVRLDHVEH